MALRKAKQIQHSPPQRLCSTSNRCKSRQLILLQQPRSHDDCCWVCGARAEQHPRRRWGPPRRHPPSRRSPAPAATRVRMCPARPAGSEPLASTPSPPPTPLGWGTSLLVHLLIHNSRLRGQQPANPLNRDQQAASLEGDV